jgi:hypothetical protein
MKIKLNNKAYGDDKEDAKRVRCWLGDTIVFSFTIENGKIVFFKWNAFYNFIQEVKDE